MLCVCRWENLRLLSNHQDGNLLTWSHSRNMAIDKKREAWFSHVSKKRYTVKWGTWKYEIK